MKKLFAYFIITIFLCTQNVLAKEFSTHKLSNGQTLIIKEVHDNPIVTIDTWIKTGSINENDNNNGVAHFLEHMFFKGTQKYPTGKFDQILESKGANTNAATSKDFTHYYIEIPSKYFDLAMELHSDMLLNPILPRNELEMERKVVLEEMARGNDSPDSVIYKKMSTNLYSSHPYKRDVIGKEDVIKTITREEMMNFYNTWYNPDNMVTVVVGDVDTNNVIKKVEEYFYSKDKTKTEKRKYKTDRIKSNIPVSVTNIDTQTGYLLIGFRGVTPKQKKESAALDVLATILGNGTSSRLYQNIQEKKHLTTSISAGHSSYKDDSIFYIKAKFDPKNQAIVEGEIWKEIKSDNFTDDEIKKAKNIIKRDTLYSRESISNIANEIGYITTLTNNPNSYNSYLKDIDKVKEKDINKVLNKYLKKDIASIAYILPKNQTVKEPYITKDTNILTSKNKTQITEFKTYPQNNNAKLISQNGNTKKYQLENGLTLLITQNKSNDIISINMLSKGGYFQESEIKKGTGNITAEMLLKGTSKYTSQEISNILDENGIEISSQMSPDAFSTSIKITKDELKTAMELFDEIINNSLLNEDDLKTVKDKKLQSIKTSKDIPSTLAFDEMKYLIWENTPYQNSMKIMEKAYKEVSGSDVKKLYNQLYSPQNTIVSVNGDVNEQEIINYYSSVFNNKKSKTYNLSKYSKQIYPISKDKSSTIQKNSNQAWVVIAYRTPPVSNTKDWAALKVIDSILGTGMSSRLFTELRDQKGLAYTVASIYQSNTLQGMFITYIGTNPKTVEQSKNGMFEQITKLKRNFVSSKELNQAKEQLYGNFLLAQETNSEKAHTVANFELTGRGYDFYNNYFEYINNVTEQDIIEAANKYFSQPAITVIVK